MSTPTGAVPGAPQGRVVLTDGVLVMTGDVDHAAVTSYHRGTPSPPDGGAPGTAEVHAVDLRGALHLGEDAMVLLLRCLPHAPPSPDSTPQPDDLRSAPTRLLVQGAGLRVRQQLDVLGVSSLLDLHD